MRTPIHIQREIVRLHFYDPRQSNSRIAELVGVAPNTVRALRLKVTGAARTLDDLIHLPDGAWCTVLHTIDRSIAKRKSAPDWDWVHEQMQMADATLEVVWREWRETAPDGVGYSAFTEGYRAWVKSRHIVMRQTHMPGDKLFVDFAGRTIEIHDHSGGPPFKAQIFLAVLGYSNLTFALAVASQKVPDWLLCHVECFKMLGGVPNWIVSDNLKAAVLSRGRDRIVINPAYRDFLKHFGTVAVPARSRRPKDKAKVEVGVQIAQRWILFRLRHRKFFSLQELNTEIRRLTDQLNAHPFKKLPANRSERFERGERLKLKPLPAEPFEMSDWRYGVRVGDDYHVEHGGSFYSVPSHLRRQKVDLRFTRTLLEVMHDGQRVALHQLSVEQAMTVTHPEHRPIAHQRVLEGEPSAMIAWASSVGPNTHKMFEHHLKNRHDLVNGLQTAKRMRELARNFGEARFEEVCTYALSLNITALRSVKSILRNQADRQALSQPLATPAVHENVRGPAYYGGAK